jgi:hypothetical protein
MPPSRILRNCFSNNRNASSVFSFSKRCTQGQRCSITWNMQGDCTMIGNLG